MRKELYTHGRHLVQKLAESWRCGFNRLVSMLFVVEEQNRIEMVGILQV
jgi:hypothetical protein